MTYKNKLLPWCIVRSLPNGQSRLIIRFRRRNDAEAHLQILRANNPTASYEIIFDVMSEQSDSPAPREAVSFNADR
ncbi:MAG TPA: hypothetical protein V6D14_07835 [Coleofasciculaceae cyanobacterium]|jgi:hypothetical protein